MPRLVAISNTQQIVNLAFNVNEDPSRAELDQALIDEWSSQYDQVVLVSDSELRAEPGDTWDGTKGVASPFVPPPQTTMPVTLYADEGPVKQNEDRSVLMSVLPRTGSELILVTHNYCDPTTWYTTSERVSSEVLTDSGDGLTFTSANPFWIDMSHGKIFDEDAISADVPHGYSVDVTSDGVQMTQREAFKDAGGDYAVDYTDGTITFFSSQTGKTVSASYSRMVDSTWTLMSDPGTRIDIESAEAQFSSDVVLSDTIQFTVWGYNPSDLPNKVPYAQTNYKSMRNFIDEAQGSYPVVPAIGGPEGRGTQTAIYGFPFRYGTVRKLSSSQGIELRVSLKDNTPYGGEHATATFYCTVQEDA